MHRPPHHPFPSEKLWQGHVRVQEGDSPLILSLPHIGTMIDPKTSTTLNDLGRSVPDTDWWLDRLYGDIAMALDATMVSAGMSRFVIDVNRDPSGQSLYPGRNTTGLCPLTTFDNLPIYHDGAEPDLTEIKRRRDAYHVPYHSALAEEITRIKAMHGMCVLYDCHSIRSVIPFLFEGELPVFNIGTNDGRSCAPEIADAAQSEAAASGMSHVVNGRFKGGWITRHYGNPAQDVHALQMELVQSAYLHEAPPWSYRTDRAAKTEPVLARIITRMLDVASRLKRS
ncbi:HutG N-formylglutamate amidohydrolase [Rhabdaerophilaceae bacterium]